ncbi:ABC-F family ATP-binding cassette domain-containing protein [Phycisphaera mikurensis]|uniref:Putative ABC transporter ATP-binding protein n=1 Tax=Phycisphaera mikurensis (strain NBRC 102666 / KCTC 22515 / FYK2301M01) TaxID=1142394 RepID=I0IFE3_PHYMF|nr:ABC-F family ATP-binding cassette domain-containing protein [Phycisphaera mikurensis]MBB6440626.1 ATP-binding cassette subfamily F protein 3 [Phycisphaera mikurensis]BAM03981.1 putative ABC transporter ATP-binding protein [Phycisphaera mikurensis NBRC 102666]
MALLSVANLAFSYGDRQILNGVNLTLDPGDHVGLVGRNGCGKSTLLKLIAEVPLGGGTEASKPEAGQIQVARGSSIGYLHQDHDMDPDATLREEAQKAFKELEDLHAELEKVGEEMADPAVYEDEKKLNDALKRYAALEERINAGGGYAVDHLVEDTLHGLGLDDTFFGVKCRDLSGGQKGRLALAKLLLSSPDVLLLDEPTNHLDIAGRKWLEGFLGTYPGAVLLISHDRWLLDRVVSKILELEDGSMVEYPGNYQKFRELRAQRIEDMRRAYEKQQTKIKSEKAFIAKFKAGQRAKQAHGRELRLNRFIKEETFELPAELSSMKLQFAPLKRSGDQVIGAENLAKGYAGNPLFRDVSLTLKRGEKVGVIGPNGAGKSTLVRCLLGQDPVDAGTVRSGSQVSVGHYKQTHEGLDMGKTVVEYLRPHVRSDTEQEARDLAGAFLFQGIEQDKPLGVLSGGERSRAVLAGLMAGGHNLLVLDEPTNHLDIPAAERIEDALRRYTTPNKKYSTAARGAGGGAAGAEGTLILITHDRMLLDNIVDRLIVFDGHGNVEVFEGTYSDYLAELEKRGGDSALVVDAQPAKALTKSQAKQQKAAKAKAPKPDAPKRKPSARWNLDDRLRELEKRLEEIDFQMADPAVFANGQEMKRLKSERGEAKQQLDELEREALGG